VKPDRIPDPGGSGKMVEDYWTPSKRMLGDAKFLDSLIAYDKDNIPPAIMKKINERIIPDENFDPEKIKFLSTTAEGIYFYRAGYNFIYHHPLLPVSKLFGFCLCSFI
jgi:dynein heavy chain